MGSRAGEIRLDWGGEEDRLFRFGIGELRKIQEGLDAGPTGIAARCMLSLAALEALQNSDYDTLARLASAKLAELVHVRVVFLQGLLGAKMPMSEAEKLVREYIDQRPIGENLAACYSLCMGSVLGPEDEPLGEPAGEVVTNPSPTASSGSPTTTAPEPSSASAPGTSMTAPSGKSPSRPRLGAAPTAATPRPARPPRKSTTP